MIGTAGTSPSALRLQPAGHRVASTGPNKSEVKVWTSASSRNTTNARASVRENITRCETPRRLSRFAREGAEEESTSTETIHSTAANAAARHQRWSRSPQQVQGAFADGRRRDGWKAHHRVEELFSAARPSSSTSSFYTSTTASTTSCGRTNGAATARSQPLGLTGSTTRTTS